MTDAELIERKKRFAEALIECNDEPFKAALIVFPEAQWLGIGMGLAKEWIRDPFVLSEKKKLLAETRGISFVPSKPEQLRDVWKIASDDKNSPEDRIKAHRLYAEMQSFIEKPLPGNVLVNQGVMIVRSHGEDKDWEQTAIEQQKTLTGDSNAIH